MEFQLSYFKFWKMILWECCTQYASKFGKLSSDHRTGKGQFSFQSQRKAMPKNAQTTAQLHSSHTLVKLKILKARVLQYVNHELPDVQAGFRKAEEPEIKLPTSTGSSKKQESSRKTLTSVYWLCQSLWKCGSQQTVENSERDGNIRSPDLPLKKFACK